MTDTTTEDAPAVDEEGRRIVDAIGMPCPRPVIELAAAIKQVSIGDEVRLLADDPAADVDVPVWCRMQRQRFLGQRDHDEGGWSFLVEKLR